MNTQRLWTIGDIARHLGIPANRVDYVIRMHNIRENQRAGILRCYDQANVEAIERAVRRTSKGDTL